ncbi:MAG TPA: glycoside hydrolase family 15 protein [Acidimicrobiales bacterium]|nr:glycoside hydrolase family 15 protein [Acidimicrobiales bacterium]
MANPLETSYPPIAEHGLIGDLQTAALVATDGTVDFFCYPRFDSPTVFASLLDRRRGGRFTLAPRGPHVTKQMYLPNTAVLVTRFLSADGVAEVVDFLPIENPTVATDRHRLVRMVRGIRGHVDLEASVEPRPDYARGSAKAQVNGTLAVFEGAKPDLALLSSWPLESRGADVQARFTVSAGDVGALVLQSGPITGQREVKADELQRLLEETTGYWQTWLAQGSYRGRWRETIERSAITLKLMTYAPTGGIVAAPTTGLPEQAGGERNWDYRYTWVRDASFSVFALLGLGFLDEAAGLATWLRDRIEERAGHDGPPLAIMYRVDGSSDLKEESLEHLEGYMGSKPVRIGNGAADQLQLDIYGEAIDSIRALDNLVPVAGDRGWRDLVRMMDWLCDNWDQPDEGVWETRGGRRPFTYARLMSWVAFDRAIRMAVDRARPADLVKWTRTRDNIYQAIHDKGWNPALQAFVQYEGGDVLDASNLLMPVVGFITPTDAKWSSTLRAMDRTLVSDSLVYRYDPKASPDGLRGSEGTFSLCTFFYVDALTRTGRLQDALLTFEKMLTYANHVGLFSEEIGLSGEQLGNFPQAFTHLSLINSAVQLNAALDNPADHNRLTARLIASMGR